MAQDYTNSRTPAASRGFLTAPNPGRIVFGRGESAIENRTAATSSTIPPGFPAAARSVPDFPSGAGMMGRRISRFQVLEELGRGGMATVWKARDEMLGRFVAIKILNEELSRNASPRRRFQQEAEIAARFEHPSIVPIYDSGETDGRAYMVMKLIEGETLAQYGARRLPAVNDVVRIGSAVADALDYANARGVLHRDVTMRNIMVTGADSAFGSVYVLDFGLARVMGGPKSSSGVLKGTAPYMAPEVLIGGEPEPRSDLYSLGVVLYELLTGCLPFPGDRPESQQVARLFVEPEPPSRLRPELSAEMDALILGLLAREPADRPASAAEVHERLEAMRPPAIKHGTAEGSASTAAPHPTPSPAPPSHDLAQRMLEQRARIYLAVLPIQTAGSGDTGAHARVLDGLALAARSGLAQLERLHVVADDTPAAGEGTRAFARRCGANLVLRTFARFVGSAVRVTFTLEDPERGLEVGGGSMDGSAFTPFELEDRFVAEVRRALGIRGSRVDSRVETLPHDPAAQDRFAQALSYLRRTDHDASLDGAIALLEGLLASEGESAAVQAALARACVYKYIKTKQRTWESRAAKACERAMELEPHAPEVLLAMGELHAAAGRYGEALSELDHALASRPDLYEALLARARSLDGARRTEEAETSCRRAIALRPDDARGYHVLGLILFRHGRYAEALDPWQRVTALTPDNASAHRNLGSALVHLDRYAEAVAAFEQSSNIRPDAMAFGNLGTVLYLLERYDECLPAFEKAVALSPSDPRAWGNLGNACHHIPGHEARTREALERAVSLMRERFDRGAGVAEDWARLSGWLASLGCHGEAERAARHALQLAPDDVHCMVDGGKTLLHIGKPEEALLWIGRAVAHGYGVESLRRSPELWPLNGNPEYERILAQGSLPRGDQGFNATHEGG